MRLPGPKNPENWQNLHRVAKLGLKPIQSVSSGQPAEKEHINLSICPERIKDLRLAFPALVLHYPIEDTLPETCLGEPKAVPPSSNSRQIEVFAMAQKLSHPVGIRDRKVNVANKSADQQIVIDLLSKIAGKCGGKREAWLTPPTAGPDGTCPPVLAEAIWDFQVDWKRRGLLHRVDGVADPGGRTITHMIALTSGVCGPKIDDQFAKILTKIQTDFKSKWTRSQRNDACTRILIPLLPSPGKKTPTIQEIAANPTKLLSLAGVKPDINGWDVLPLFLSDSGWLRSPKMLAHSCAIPTSPKPSASVRDPAHEDECTCSDSVQIGGKCWLNGTVNYGTFGIMVKLCADEFFPSAFSGLVLTYAETMIKAYKQYFAPEKEKEDPALPIEWVRATFHGGPSGTPSVDGNRPHCRCGCSLDGSVVHWDYVWEPVKTRRKAIHPGTPKI